MTVKLEKIPFEDALNQIGFGKYNFFLLLFCGGVILGMVFESFSVSYLSTASACEFGTSSVQQGLIAGMPLIGIIATSHIWGYMADKRGRTKILRWTLLVGFITGALASLSPNWIVLCVFKLLSSSAVSGTFAISFTLLSECTLQAKRSAMIVLTTSVFLISSGIMAVIAMPVLPLKFSYYIPFLDIQFNSWRLLNLIYALPCCLGAVGVSLVYESPKFLLSMGKEEESLKVLRGMFAINKGKDGEDFQVKSVVLEDRKSSTKSEGLWSSVVSQITPLFKPPLAKNTLLLAITFALVYFSVNPYIVWLPYITDGLMKSVERGEVGLTFCQMLKSSQNVTVEQITDCSLNQSAMTMVLAIGTLLCVLNTIMSSLIAFCGRKRLLIGLQLVAGIAGLCINASTHWISTTVLFIIFISNVMNFGVLTTFSVDVFPTYLRAMAVCLTAMVGRGSAVVGINVLKDMLDNNCESSFYVFGALCALGGLVGFLLPSDEQLMTKKGVDDINQME